MSTDFRALCAELVDALDVADTALLGTDRAKGAKVVRDALNRARAALAEGEKGLSDEELNRLMDSIHWKGSPNHWGRKVARAVLARWGSTPRPIPISERLPGAEDCDADGRCFAWDWLFSHWRMVPSEWLENNECYDWWLPAHALPIPTLGEEQ